MKVALLNPYYWPEVQRGSERLIHDLAADLAKRGHRPRVITSHSGPRQASTEDGFEVIRNWRPPEWPLQLRRIQEGLSHVPFTYMDLRSGDDEIAQSFFPTDAQAALRWKRSTGRPVVYHYGGIPERHVTSHKRWRMQMLERATRDSDAVVGPSKAVADGLWKWWGVEARVIYPGVDLEAFATADGRAEEPTIACAADPVDERKRIPLLVEAFRRVRRSRPTARLVLMRPRTPELEAALTDDGVEFFDASPDAIPGVFARAWATALPAPREAFGIVLVESLAAGRPVVAMNECGPAEIVNSDDIGRLFEGDDPKVLAHSLEEALELAQDPKTAERARARAADFTTERTAIEHESLYEELLA